MNVLLWCSVINHNTFMRGSVMKKELDFTELSKLTESKARKYLEKLRWPDGKPICPHCGVEDKAYALKAKPDSDKPVREGVYKCRHCRKQFTVTVGTVFEGSRIPLNKWIMAISLMCSSKKGISAHQLHRMLNVTYRTAWFMCHRVRCAMDEGPLYEMLRGIVEADEAYIGGKGSYCQRGRSTEKKAAVFTLVERNGRARSMVTERVNAATLLSRIKENVQADATLMTDEYSAYRRLGLHYKHGKVTHSTGVYADGEMHVNTAEGYFALLKRGIHGTFHHVGRQHLDKYLKEFDFRWNARHISDKERLVKAIEQTGGKRLMYKKPKQN